MSVSHVITGSTQSKTVRVIILKIGRKHSEKVVKKSIINVMKSGNEFKLALIREDA